MFHFVKSLMCILLSDYVLLSIFTVEMIMKMVAYCLFRYFCKIKFDPDRNRNVVSPHVWNCLDFTVVVAG